jgi:hypothetical protein
VRLQIKPMADGLQLPAEIPKYCPPSFVYFSDHNQLADKSISGDVQ